MFQLFAVYCPRNIKGFIVQGGDPTGTGKGGQSIYGKYFDDEIVVRFLVTCFLSAANFLVHVAAPNILQVNLWMWGGCRHACLLHGGCAVPTSPPLPFTSSPCSHITWVDTRVEPCVLFDDKINELCNAVAFRVTLPSWPSLPIWPSMWCPWTSLYLTYYIHMYIYRTNWSTARGAWYQWRHAEPIRTDHNSSLYTTNNHISTTSTQCSRRSFTALTFWIWWRVRLSVPRTGRSAISVSRVWPFTLIPSQRRNTNSCF